MICVRARMRLAVCASISFVRYFYYIVGIVGIVGRVIAFYEMHEKYCIN